MHRWTPFVRHFKERHLGSTIALKLDGMLEQLELTSDDFYKFCVNDNAANMQVNEKLPVNIFYLNIVI